MKKYKIIQLRNKTYHFRELSIDDQTQVSNLFNECEDYFNLVEGKVAEEKDTKEFFEDLPPGKEIEDKNLYGVFDEVELIGVVDMVEDFPQKGEWIIGLMLLHPNTRGKGLGKAIHNIIVDIARENKVKKLRVGVVQQNENALKYWKRIGYKEVERTSPRMFGQKESIIIVLNYFL